jgi:hypothetical protein
MPSFSAQWICAKLGGLAMIQSATNGFAADSELESSSDGSVMPSPAL